VLDLKNIFSEQFGKTKFHTSFLQNFSEPSICQYAFKYPRMETSKAVVLRHYSPDLMITFNLLMKSGHQTPLLRKNSQTLTANIQKGLTNVFFEKYTVKHRKIRETLVTSSDIFI